MFKVTYANGWVSYFEQKPNPYNPDMLWTLNWRMFEWSEYGYWIQIDGQL